MPPEIYASDGECGGYEKLSTITSSIGFTAAKVEPTSGVYRGRIAKAVLITVETASIRFTMDTTTPVVTGASEAGSKIDAGQSYVVRGHRTIRNFRCINETASNGAKVFCHFFY